MKNNDMMLDAAHFYTQIVDKVKEEIMTNGKVECGVYALIDIYDKEGERYVHKIDVLGNLMLVEYDHEGKIETLLNAMSDITTMLKAQGEKCNTCIYCELNNDEDGDEILFLLFRHKKYACIRTYKIMRSNVSIDESGVFVCDGVELVER